MNASVTPVRADGPGLGWAYDLIGKAAQPLTKKAVEKAKKNPIIYSSGYLPEDIWKGTPDDHMLVSANGRQMWKFVKHELLTKGHWIVIYWINESETSDHTYPHFDRSKSGPEPE